MIRTEIGLPPGYESQAAALYWEAFGGKLGKLLGPDDRGRAFFTDSVNPDAVVAAFEGDTLLGIAAFKERGKGFSTAGLADLWRHYRLGMFWRMIPLLLLERDAPAGILQMDGISVTKQARGRGVGTRLFDALFQRAKAEGYDRVTLDVIDTNPRAKALYERLGFVATGEVSTSILRPLLGFRSATRMVRTL